MVTVKRHQVGFWAGRGGADSALVMISVVVVWDAKAFMSVK